MLPLSGIELFSCNMLSEFASWARYQSHPQKPASVGPIVIAFRCDEINPRMHSLELAIFEQGSIVKVG